MFLHFPEWRFATNMRTIWITVQYLIWLYYFCLQKTIPQASFTVLVQSATFIRISYRHQYLIDITLCEGDRVLVRDGAYSLFDSQPVSYTNNYVSAQGLKVSGIR